MNVNYIVKLEDAKAADVQKALEQAGIKVRSILEVYKDKDAEKETPTASSGGNN